MIGTEAGPGADESLTERQGFSGGETFIHATVQGMLGEPDIGPEDPRRALLGKALVVADTQFNDRKNDEVYSLRNAAAAEIAVQAHGEMTTKILIATEMLADTDNLGLSDAAKQFVESGGQLEDLMAEVAEYEAANGDNLIPVQISAPDKELSDARKQFVELTVKSRGLLHRTEKQEARGAAEERYMAAFKAKLEYLSSIPKGDREAALNLSLLPQVVEKMGFDSKDMTLEELAGNQLHVLADALCREQLFRQHLEEKASDRGAKKLVRMVTKNKVVRGLVAGSIFAASAFTLAHGLPESQQHLAELTEKGLGTLGAMITSRELLEGTFEGYESFSERFKLKKAKGELAADPQLADLALRTAYNQIEAIPGDRKGTDDKDENLRRFDNIQEDYEELYTAPGGKPYSAEMMLEYSKQLYLEQRPMLDSIAASSSPEERKQIYGRLTEVILGNDLEKFKTEITGNRVKKNIFRGLSILSAVVASKYLAHIDEATKIASHAAFHPGGSQS